MSIELFRKLPRISTMAGSYNVNDISMPCLYGLVVYAYAALATWYLNVKCIGCGAFEISVCNAYVCMRSTWVCCHSADTHKHVLFKIIRTQYLLGWLFHRRHPFHGYLNSISHFHFYSCSLSSWFFLRVRMFFPRLLCFILSHVITSGIFTGDTFAISNSYQMNVNANRAFKTEESYRQREAKQWKKNNLQITIITVIIIRAKKE